MHRLAALTLAVLVAGTARVVAADTERLAYPPAPADGTVTNYFGTNVADPFRPLEDIDAAPARAWVRAEAALTESYFATLPGRDALRERLRRLWNYERVSIPQHEGGTYVVSRNTGLQNQAVVYVSRGADGPQRVLLDPNALSPDGTVALGASALSHDGKLFAYATQTSGSDWMTWHVRSTADGRDLGDRLEWAKFSGAAWSADDRGFYYSAYDPPAGPQTLNVVNANQKVYYHALGTPQSADRLIYRRADHPDWFLSAAESDDGRFTFVYPSKGNTNGVLYRDRKRSGSDFVELFANEVARYDTVDNDGPLVYVLTTAGAPRGKLIVVDVEDGHAARDVIGEAPDTLESVTSVGGRFFATYLHDAHSEVKIFDRSGRFLGDVALPGIGSVTGFEGRKQDALTYYSFTSYTTPATVYAYDVTRNVSTPYHRPAIAFDSSDYVTEQVWYASKDGTRVPMFVSHKKGLARTGDVPTLLYGYGGFDISVTPAFSSAVAAWLQMGNVFAVPSLRGGGEFGEAWHEAGKLDRKQNVFDDFAAAARYLIDARYTSSSKLAIWGGSNGGLLCGATLEQQPHLIAAALCDVGVMDMLRFQHFTIGKAWVPEYGSADADPRQFATLYAYSPLHNLKAGTAYPATLVSTGDHDDRVFPAHSFKFAAALQQAQAGPAPVLLFVEQKAGHGAGKPTQKIIEESADKFAFLAQALGFEPAALP